MLPILTKILGALGLFLVIVGVLTKKRQKANWLFAFGGLSLLIYSIYLKDPVFIPLQSVFIIASLYELYKSKQKTL